MLQNLKYIQFPKSNISNDIKVYFIIISAGGKETATRDKNYVFTKKGKYIIRVVAMDEDNNMSSLEYTVEVKNV
mgnify:CR=1 FL=1